MPSLSRAHVNKAMSWVVVAALGAVEGIFGRVRYLGDAISYLNVSRAVSAGDWKGIFDPMWSAGYPFLVALVRVAFPHTAEGEWHAITLLNWLIFLGAFASWRYLLRQALEFYQPPLIALMDRPVVVWSSTCAFLSCTLCLNTVSSVDPDLLVTALFILASAQMLAVLNRPRLIRAIGLGLILGAGCWVKSVFFAFACIFFLALLLARWSGKLSWRMLGGSALIYLAMVAPYVAAVSISYGQFTLGVSGALNYSFHVNHMPHWMNWQGGSPFGAPLHPTRQLVSDLPVFEFASPFRTTYPPYNNLAYWYRGSREFFSPKLQILGIRRTLQFLVGTIVANPFLWGLVLVGLAITIKRDWRICARPTARFFWPLFLPTLLGFATYLTVHIEDRYLSPFILVFSLFPLLLLVDPALKAKRVLAAFVLLTYTVAAIAELGVADRAAFMAAIHRTDFRNDAQWRLAMAMPSYGLHGGDAVAVIDGQSPAFRCFWAYVAELRIVAEFGSLPWTIAPWDRMRSDHIAAEPGDQDYGVYFWKKLTPDQRVQVTNAFHGAGARAVLSLSKPDAYPEPGWQQVAGTKVWIYEFAPENVSKAAVIPTPYARNFQHKICEKTSNSFRDRARTNAVSLLSLLSESSHHKQDNQDQNHKA